ncbi:MAG: DNA methyltransferase [Candidatus Hodarchaeota archaeon]
MTISNNDIICITDLAKPEREKGYTRTFYSYPAKFLSKLPHGLIKRFSKKNDLVFDPFVGGGTTGLEAMLLERQFIGYDLNPFAILVSNVKTTHLNSETLHGFLNSILSQQKKLIVPKSDVLDKEDKICLGMKISHEINSLFESILINSRKTAFRQFFELALIHSIKIVGRRDFEFKKNWKKASILPIFERKARKMIREISSLPKNPKFIPVFKLASNNQVELERNSVDLIVTSPPYKDKDVEYQQIQIQRRTLHRSKRSNVISAILGTLPLHKNTLCGGSGANYWENSLKSLKECHRVLKLHKFAFYWTGFKNSADLRHFEKQLDLVGFDLLTTIQVKLSDDRVASGRSTHHGRSTGMMSHDYLFITKRSN